MRFTCLAIAIYIVMAVGTWGNAYWWARSDCKEFEDERQQWNCEHDASIAPLFAAAAWPIYISIRLQETEQ